MTRWISIPLALLVTIGLTSTASAQTRVNTGWFSDTAIEGYDPVAYFTEGRPIKGDTDHRVQYNGANWHFANAEHAAKFQADPARYAPQYGGFCAFAVAKGKRAGIDPEAWSIVAGRLFLNYDQEVQAQWEANRDEFIRRADANWPEVGKQ